MRYFKFKGLLLSSGWLTPAYVGVDDSGTIRYLSAEQPVPDPGDAGGVEHVAGYALPGFRNAHSHAFQYAMAGMAERHAPGSTDDFWSWREAMYTCALSLRPDDMEAIAAMLYTEMLRYGYTHVAEFHYLHHDEHGRPYAHLAEMAERLISAAVTAGIKITLVPVWYQRGDFDKPAFPKQRRFIIKSRDEYFKMLEASRAVISNRPHARLGFGVHSLRAVEPTEVVAAVAEGPSELPIHLHVSEQLKEVETADRVLGMRPVEWLLRNLPVDGRFHLVHCTHLNDTEVVALAQSGAQVMLCPGTEGNLGDGIFRLSEFSQAGGRWSIGTDSQIQLNPVEDLRWLDYVQRLVTHRRNTFDYGAQRLTHMVWHAGNQALGILDQREYFLNGQPLDAVVYNASSPLLLRTNMDACLSSIVYTTDSSAILGTMVDGQWVIREGRHADAERIRHAYDRAIRSIIW